MMSVCVCSGCVFVNAGEHELIGQRLLAMLAHRVTMIMTIGNELAPRRERWRENVANGNGNKNGS